MHVTGLQRLPRRLRLVTATALLAAAIGVVDVTLPTARVHAAAVTYNGAAGAERISVIGDSVMAAIRWYGTWTPLRTYNYTVDVESCRRTLVPSCNGREGYRPDTTVNAMRRLEGQLGSVLTIGTGYDDPGSTFADAVDAVMAEARRQDIPVVVWATMRTEGVVYVGPTYAANAATYRANNRVLFAKQAEYGGRLVVADWATYSADHPEWVEWDGVHLTPGGATAMAGFIRDQSAIAIRRISVPSAPTLTTSVLSSSQVRLSWTAPASAGAAPIEHYSYQRSSDGGRTWQSGYAVASARSAVVSGLTNGVTYRFRIAAHNRIGWGAWSRTVTVTPQVVAPSAPWLSAAAVGPGQVKLWWTAPKFNGGAPIEYYSFQRSSDGGRTWQVGYAGASVRSVVVSGLTGGATYRFRIVAHNRIGFGAWSRTVTLTPRVVTPSAPWLSAAAGPGQVRLWWTAPTFTGGAPIEHYAYQRSSDGGRTWQSGYAVASARSAVVSGLTNGVTYRFRIAAHNRIGWSPWSRTVIVTPSLAGVSTDDAGAGEAPVVPTTITPTTTLPTTTVPTTPAPDVTAPTTTPPTQPPAVATVGDFIWLDSDGNGVQDAHEPGFPGVTVRLIGPDETVVAEGVSDSSGHYALTTPSPVPFMLEVVLPDGYAPTVVDVGADDTLDSDADPVDVVDDLVERSVRVPSDSSNGDEVDLDVGLVVVQPPMSTTTLPASTTTSTLTTVPTPTTTTATNPTTTATPTTIPPSSTPTTPPPTAPPTTAAPTPTVVASTPPETAAPTEPSGPDG